MYAVVETGGKQYKIAEGDVLQVERLEGEKGDEVYLDKVLALGEEDSVKVGEPYLEGIKVKAKIVEQGKKGKIIVYKYKAKKNYRRKKGHRQPFTRLVVKGIEKEGPAGSADVN